MTKEEYEQSLTRSEQLQLECIDFSKDLLTEMYKRGKVINSEVAQMCWIYRKIADLQIMVESLQKSKQND